jgi:hypothetical protein
MPLPLLAISASCDVLSTDPVVSPVSMACQTQGSAEGQLSIRRTKINSFDPALLAVSTAYPAEPLLTLFDPPIELASTGPVVV